MAAMEPNWRRPDPFGFPMARGGVRSPGIGRSPPIRLGRACPTRHRLARLSVHLMASRPWPRRLEQAEGRDALSLMTLPVRLIGLAVVLAVSLVLATLAAQAQEVGKVARIGMLANSPSEPFVKTFKQGLRELGYVEGQNISIEYRWTEGRNERLSGLAGAVVRAGIEHAWTM